METYLGMGVMLNVLVGNKDSVNAWKSAVGKKIASLTKDEDTGLHFIMDDGTRIRLFDNGQSCCEHRYMTCDDDLAAHVGATLTDAEVRDGPTTETDGEPHEMAFLVVTTSAGQFTCETHNEHNGYYGGFSIMAEIEKET